MLICRHIGDDDRLQAWTVVRGGDFLRRIDYLARHLRIVSLGEALSAMQGHDDNGTARLPMAVVTFDDGYAGDHRHLLAIVELRHLPVTVFVASEAAERAEQVVRGRCTALERLTVPSRVRGQRRVIAWRPVIPRRHNALNTPVASHVPV